MVTFLLVGVQNIAMRVPVYLPAVCSHISKMTCPYFTKYYSGATRGHMSLIDISP